MPDHAMGEHVVLVTGHLARPRLERVMEAIGRDAFAWSVVDVGVKVAALMTEEIVRRRLKLPEGATKVVFPGRARVDLDRLSEAFGVPMVRGPEEVADLPRWFGRGGGPPDLSRYDLRLFVEMVDAPRMSVEAIVARARRDRAAGGDVVDLGCLPGMPFPHLQDAVGALKAEGFTVSVDSGDPDDLVRGGEAGADYLLSLSEKTLWVLDKVAAVPILIPAEHGDLESLARAADAVAARGRAFLADPVLDPIHFGFTASIERYAAFRRMRPDAEMMIGTGNLTELTEADTTGITTILLGIASELSIRNALLVQVSPHTRRTVEEHDAARRMLYAAKADGALPKGYSAALMALHDRVPFPNTPEEIAGLAAQVRDANFRIETAADGIHIYNRDLHAVVTDPFAVFEALNVGADGAHAFYLGAELARAEIAFRLGKRYAQDEPLDWGVAADRETADPTRLKDAGHTLRAVGRVGRREADETTPEPAPKATDDGDA
ncbi:dihydropteroate synthase [Rhizobiales bacterium Sp-1]|uniref:Dihydropteroate synthase n=2 Tax=Segnochrobactrum spirostomi TaxID=2608987 RepID=A0A6A7XYZ6_9HYPH|nr:dihydropteroate synthase [Segnochrobactrum spirostomi]